MNNELSTLADYIANRLIEEGFIVHRYNAYTTNSIYLKLDYGVCNSIRISDHPGKKHLKYRYNTGSFVKEFQEVKDKYERFYYRMDKVEKMIKRIIKDRDFKQFRYGAIAYQKFMYKNKYDKKGSCGFWREAVLLDKEE